MGWLLELLLEGIREICSQFIVDMMELVTEMFTELLSCNLSLFEELFSVVTALYKNVIVPMGIAILLLILVWQLFKSMFGKSVNGEEPIELLIRSAIALFFVVAAKPIVNYILKFAGTPYQWVVGTEITVESFSGFVSALEGVTESLGVGKLSISLLMLIMQFVVAWNYFKMLFVIAERYVLLGVFSYTAPLAFSTGGSKSTNNILASWAKMFGGQVVLIILNAWCMKMFLSGYGNMMASSYGFTKFFVATLCLVGFCKITFKMDSYLASLGVNLGRPSAGMGAMGLIMAASRIISQIGKGAAGGSGSSSGGETGTSAGTTGSSMTEGFAGPIPMMPENTMGMEEMPAENDFGETADAPEKSGAYSDFSFSEKDSACSNSVLEELGVATVEGTGSAGIDPGIKTDPGNGIGRTEGAGYEKGSSSESGGTLSENNGSHSEGFEKEPPMDMSFAGIPEYEEGTGITADHAAGDGIGISEDGTSESAVIVAPDYGSGGSGIVSEMGDYPVEEMIPESTSEHAMELDGSSIAGMGTGMDIEGISYGNAGDAYGNVHLASRGANASRSAANPDGNGVKGSIPGMEYSGGSDGIISEVGAEFASGSIESYGTGKPVGVNRNPLEQVRENEECGAGEFPLSEISGANAGILGEMGTEGGTIRLYEPEETKGTKQNTSASGIIPETGSTESGGGASAKLNGILEEMPVPGERKMKENPHIADGVMEDFDTPQKTEDQSLKPLEEMEGHMNYMDAGSSIPFASQKAYGSSAATREFREVPKTREELRRRQQSRKEQNPTEEIRL